MRLTLHCPVTLWIGVYLLNLTDKLQSIGETSRSLCEWVKEHNKVGSNSSIYQHCSGKGHPPPNIDQL